MLESILLRVQNPNLPLLGRKTIRNQYYTAHFCRQRYIQLESESPSRDVVTDDKHCLIPPSATCLLDHRRVIAEFAVGITRRYRHGSLEPAEAIV